MSVWSVCLCAGHDHEQYKNGRTDLIGGRLTRAQLGNKQLLDGVHTGVAR